MTSKLQQACNKDHHIADKVPELHTSNICSSQAQTNFPVTAQESGQETTITPLACNEMKRANDGVVAESEIIIRGTETLAKFCSKFKVCTP